MFYAHTKDGHFVGGTSEDTLVKHLARRGITDYTISQQSPKRPTITDEQRKASIKATLLKAVDNYMDKTVQERGYDNIAKCVTYEGDEDPIFNAEGTAAKKWRSRVYRKLYNVLAEVESGVRPIPTEKELIAELPVIEWEGN